MVKNNKRIYMKLWPEVSSQGQIRITIQIQDSEYDHFFISEWFAVSDWLSIILYGWHHAQVG